MDNQNQNPVTPPIPAVGTPTLQSDLPVSEIVSAMKSTPTPAAAPTPPAAPLPLQEITPPPTTPTPTPTAPVPPVTAPATPAPRSTAVLSPDSQSGAPTPTPTPTPNPLSENPDQVKTPGQ